MCVCFSLCDVHFFVRMKNGDCWGMNLVSSFLIMFVHVIAVLILYRSLKKNDQPPAPPPKERKKSFVIQTKLSIAHSV